MEHIFEKVAFVYPLKSNQPILDGYEFDIQKGYWVNSETHTLLINDPNGPKPQSKKCDQETGEDKKGD